MSEHEDGNVTARRAAALMLALLLPIVASAQTKIKPGFNLFSAQDDVQIGAQSAAQAEQQLPILRDAQVQAYVNRIGQRLAANAGGPNFNYQFRVVNASDINAFAQAVIYGVDNGISVLQEALGTINNTSFAQAAVDYAYKHGVLVDASEANESVRMVAAVRRVAEGI